MVRENVSCVFISCKFRYVSIKCHGNFLNFAHGHLHAKFKLAFLRKKKTLDRFKKITEFCM